MTGLHDGQSLARAQERAEARATAKLRFFKHLAVALVVSLLCLAINLLTYRGYLWSAWPALALGISVAFHAFKVYGGHGFEEGLKRRLVAKEMDKERDKR